jgi:AAHS family 4-hydroxybenzoate transporter-like MFS transporter
MTFPLDVAAVLDRAPMRGFHARILGLCALTLLVDGFDLLALASAAPAVAADLAIPAAGFGPALSASLLGAAVGGAAAGPVGDRIGRRPLLIAMYLLAAVATAGTAWGRGLPQLVALRFATGLFIGGAIPPALALAAEYMPVARRQLLLILMVSCSALGAAVASLTAPSLVAAFGWPAIFLLGGGLALGCAVLLALGLPESLRFLVLKRPGDLRIAALARRIDPRLPADAGFRVDDSGAAAGASPRRLFAAGATRTTLLLWLVYFGTQAQLYFLNSWLPTLFREAGLSLAVALYGTMAHQAGGVVGSALFGLWSDRIAPQRVMAWMYALAIVTIAPLGFVVHDTALLFVLAVASGVGAVGAQSCLHAFAATFYPTGIRTTGVGWAVSVGRLGAILSPLAGGAMLGAGMGVAQILLAVTLAPALCLAGVELLKAEQDRWRVPVGGEGMLR